MPKPLVVEYRTVSKELRDQAVAQLASLYRIGKVIQRITSQPGKYGQNALAQLAQATTEPGQSLEATRSRLWDCRNIAAEFSWDEIKKFMAEGAQYGIDISFKHLRALVTIKGPSSEALREEYRQRVLVERLSANTLERELAARYGSRATPQSGRKPRRPASPLGCCSQIEELVASIDKRHAGWDEVLFELPVDRVDDELISRVEQTRFKLEQLQNLANTLITRCDELMQRKQQAAVAVETPAKQKPRKRPAQPGSDVGERVKRAREKAAANTADRG